jgi:alpha-L-rhamnosidase
MVNRLWQNIDWGQRGNLESVPTDCPQRDERLGWMGDAEMFWPTACYNRDMQSFTHKWTRDVREAQSPEGGYSDVSPRVVDPSDGAPAWGDAGVIVPYAAWRQYGDTALIRENWVAMTKWLDYIDKANPNHLWRKRRNNDFGDWVPANSDTDHGVIATAFFAQDARMMADMAHAIGDTDAETRFRALFDQIRAAFVVMYVKDDGTVGNGSQTCYALALHMALLDDAHRVAAAGKLVDDIEKRGGHLSTGFIGTGFLLPALSDCARDDVAYRLLLNTTYPSWGYEISKGATTIWERWNGDTGDPGMNSFNHYAFGAVGDWLYRYLGGIGQAADSTGFRHIVIHPHPGAGIDWAKCDYDSPYGKIATDWKRDGSGLTLSATVPPNTAAEVWVPGGSEGQGGSGARFVRNESGCAVYAVGAGTYTFTGRP